MLATSSSPTALIRADVFARHYYAAFKFHSFSGQNRTGAVHFGAKYTVRAASARAQRRIFALRNHKYEFCTPRAAARVRLILLFEI